MKHFSHSDDVDVAGRSEQEILDQLQRVDPLLAKRVGQRLNTMSGDIPVSQIIDEEKARMKNAFFSE